MAIDPSIPLSVRPVQVQTEDPFTKALTLRGMIQRQQLEQQQIQTGQLANQKNQLMMADQEKVRQAWQESGGDPDKLIKRSIELGAGPDTITGLQQHFLNVRKTNAEIDDKALAGRKYHNEQMAGLTAQALALDDATYAAQWPNLKAAALRIDPQLQLPDQPIPKEDLQHLRLGFMTDDALLKEEEEKRKKAAESRAVAGEGREQQLFPAKLSEAETKAQAGALSFAAQKLGAARSQEEYARVLNSLPHGVAVQFPAAEGWDATETPAAVRQVGMSPEQQQAASTRSEEVAKLNSPAQLAARASDPNRTPEERAAAKAALKLLEQHAIASRPVVQTVIPGLNGGGAGGGPTTQVTGDDYLKTLPAGTAAQVRAIAEGRATIPSGSSRSQAAIQLRDAVFRYDPGFSEQRAQVRRAFTTGTDGRNIGNLNTAIAHLGRLGDLAEGLQNGSFTPGNELYNYFKDKFGSPAVTNFALLKDAVAGEMAAALKGNATDIEIEKMGKSIKASNSPEQMRRIVGEGMGILNDKATTYNERYHSLMPDDAWSPILPSARAQLERHGIKAPAATAAGAGASPKATHRYNPATGQIEEIK